MLTIDISIKGIQDTTKFLNKLKDRVKSPESGLKKGGDYLLDFYQNKVFPSQGAALDGNVWAPLAPSTVREKMKNWPGRGILVRTGALQRGFRMMTGSNYIKIYNAVEYGKYHMTGTSKMPQRLYMGVDERQTKKVVELVIDDIMSIIL